VIILLAPFSPLSISVGKWLIFYKNALSIIEMAEKTPIVVSIDSSGIPRPLQTAPVLVLNESV